MQTIRTAARSIFIPVLVLSATMSAHAQVDWSGNNVPADGGMSQAGAPVRFVYQIYDAGRTEPDGRGAGLGAALYWRDADLGGSFGRLDMTYAGQAGIGGHDDLFAALLAPESYGGASRIEYFTVAYDSLVTPVHADTTRQDVNGHPPNFIFTLGVATMPHRVYVHFSICLNGRSAGNVVVHVDPRTSPPFDGSLMQVSPGQLPDIWETDVFLEAGVAQRIEYRFVADGGQETASGAPVVHTLLMTVGSFLQGNGTDSWGGGPLGCHLTETLAHPVKVHFSVCMGGVSHAGAVCVSGSPPELGHYESSVVLQSIQPNEPDLFEGDVVFPTGGTAVIQYKYQMSDCATWEDPWGGSNQTTNRFLYIGGGAETYVAPTSVWNNAGPNSCGPPTRVSSITWSGMKNLYR